MTLWTPPRPAIIRRPPVIAPPPAFDPKTYEALRGTIGPRATRFGGGGGGGGGLGNGPTGSGSAPAGAGNFRYWRVATDTPASDYMSLYELEYRATIGGADLLDSVSYTGSVSGADFGSAANATDNNLTTFWSSNYAASGKWHRVDFGGTSREVQEILYVCRNGGAFSPDVLRLEHSADGSSWTTYFTIDEFDATNGGGFDGYADPPQRRYSKPWSDYGADGSARFWRLRFPANQNGGGSNSVSIGELRIYDASNNSLLNDNNEYPGIFSTTVAGGSGIENALPGYGGGSPFLSWSDASGFTIVFDWCRNVKIGKIEITNRADGQFTESLDEFYVENSMDGSTWSEDAHITAIAWGGYPVTQTYT